MHLASIAPALPDVTRAFVLAPWYHDPKAHDCPHDGWLLRAECSSGGVSDPQMNFVVELIGAYHDRLLTFRYHRVEDLNVSFSPIANGQRPDWICDEFNLAGEQLVSHEIRWSDDRVWRIVAAQVEFESKALFQVAEHRP